MLRRLCFNDGSLSHNSDTESDEEVKSPFTHSHLPKWTASEDDKLRNIVNKAGTYNWAKIASIFPGKTDRHCELRWSQICSDFTPWTADEDKMVSDLVHQYGPTHWSFIAKHLSGRNIKECRERWFNHLSQHTADANRGSPKLQPFNHSDSHEPAAMKKAMDNPAVPFSHYSYNYPVSRTSYVQSGGYRTEEQCQYKTVYPVKTCLPHTLPSEFHSIMTDGYVACHSVTMDTTPIKFTKLNNGSAECARIDERSLSHNKSAGLIPITDLKPGILRRKRRHDNESFEAENRPPLHLPSSYLTGQTTSCESKSVIYSPSTPLKTPVKLLPFSPSQFFNSPSCAVSTVDTLTSTPVSNDKLDTIHTPHHTEVGLSDPSTPVRNVFQTPTVTQLVSSKIHTPTPFKRALAELEQKSGIVQTEHHTPMHIHSDLQEVIAQDVASSSSSAGLRRSASYRATRNVSSVQQNLERRLSALLPEPNLANRKFTTLPEFKPETPSKSLIDDASLNLSPPSIFKESLYPTAMNFHEGLCAPDSPMIFKKSSSRANLSHFNLPVYKDTEDVDFTKNPGFMMIACGKTEDQLLMTSIAHRWMKLNNHHRLIVL